MDIKKEISVDQVRKSLDKAYLNGYSIEQYPTDDDIWDYLEQLEEITIADYLDNGHKIAWFADLYSSHDAVDDVLYDLTEDRFLTEEECEGHLYAITDIYTI